MECRLRGVTGGEGGAGRWDRHFPPLGGLHSQSLGWGGFTASPWRGGGSAGGWFGRDDQAVSPAETHFDGRFRKPHQQRVIDHGRPQIG